MNPDKIKKLVKIVEDSNISELEISRWGKRVRIVKNFTNSNGTYSAQQIIVEKQVSAVQNSLLETSAPVGSIPEPEKIKETPTAKPQEESNVEQIRSPMVGTFDEAPAPDADPYIKNGDKIKSGKILCVIEAMKLMNEIEAEISGTIVEILVENAQPVEYNQPLFKVALD